MISSPSQDRSSKTSKMSVSKQQIAAEKSSLKSVSNQMQIERHLLDYQNFPSSSSMSNNKTQKSIPNSGKSNSRLYPRLSNSSSAESHQTHSPSAPFPSPFKKKKSLSFNTKYLMDTRDTGGRMDPHGPSIIYGVESEEVEEINDAYNDLIGDLGEVCHGVRGVVMNFDQCRDF